MMALHEVNKLYNKEESTNYNNVLPSFVTRDSAVLLGILVMVDCDAFILEMKHIVGEPK